MLFGRCLDCLELDWHVSYMLFWMLFGLRVTYCYIYRYFLYPKLCSDIFKSLYPCLSPRRPAPQARHVHLFRGVCFRVRVGLRVPIRAQHAKHAQPRQKVKSQSAQKSRQNHAKPCKKPFQPKPCQHHAKPNPSHANTMPRHHANIMPSCQPHAKPNPSHANIMPRHHANIMPSCQHHAKPNPSNANIMPKNIVPKSCQHRANTMPIQVNPLHARPCQEV